MELTGMQLFVSKYLIILSKYVQSSEQSASVATYTYLNIWLLAITTNRRVQAEQEGGGGNSGEER